MRKLILGISFFLFTALTANAAAYTDQDFENCPNNANLSSCQDWIHVIGNGVGWVNTSQTPPYTPQRAGFAGGITYKYEPDSMPAHIVSYSFSYRQADYANGDILLRGDSGGVLGRVYASANVLYVDGGNTSFFNVVNDEWYTVEVQLDINTNQHRSRVANGTWSSWVSDVDELPVSIEINHNGGSGEFYLDDFQVTTAVAADPLSTAFSVSVAYPLLDNNYSANILGSDTYPLKFKYDLPNLGDLGKVDFILEQYEDNTYTGDTVTSFEDSYQDLDPYNRKRFTIPFDTSVTGTYFLKIIERFDVFGDGQDIQEYSVYFNLISSDDVNDVTLQKPLANDDSDLGSWGNQIRDLFLPRYGYFEDDFMAPMQYQWDRIFGDVSTVLSSYNTVLGEMSGTDSPQVGVSLFGSETVNVLDFSLFTPYLSSIREMMKYILYIAFFYWMIHHLLHIFKP